MPHNHHHNSFAAILLTTLMLATTACSTTNQTTITAPGDTTATPGDTTPTPGDDTTPAPTVSSGANTPTTESTTATESTTRTPSPESTPKEPDRYIHQHPDFFLTNLNDTSTPLGKLCWALWEYVRIDYIEFVNSIAENSPIIEITDSVLSDDITDDGDEQVGPVSINNEETEDTYTYLDALSAIQEPQIVGVADDPSLSAELQAFAKAFFELIKSIEDQAKVVDYKDIDYSSLPYKDLDSLPNAGVFDKAASENPTKCQFPSVEDVEEWDEQIDAVNNVTD